MTYTKEQIEAIQSAGVPMEGLWSDGEWYHCKTPSQCSPTSQHRQRPGHTFNGDTARKLAEAGVEVECYDGQEWYPAGIGYSDFLNIDHNGDPFIYRLAQPPSVPATVELDQLRHERDEARRERDELQLLFDKVCGQRNKFPGELAAVCAERDDLAAKLGTLKKALKGILG